MTAGGSPPGCTPLSLYDRSFIEPLLARTPSRLGTRTFAGVYLWRDHFHYAWSWIQGYLCLFAHYGSHVYMPWPPLPGDRAQLAEWPAVVATAFANMDGSEDAGAAARIEGVGEDERGAFLAAGYEAQPHATEYCYRRAELVALRGNPYKSKRWAWNDFVKHRVFTLEPLRTQDADGCIMLYRQWRDHPKMRKADPYRRALADDSQTAHRRALCDLENLGLLGLVVRIDGVIEGYTIGGAVGPELFGVYFEIANPEINGLSVYLFRELCRTQTQAEWITAMDDSGVPELARAKLSYRPAQLVRSWLIRRPPADRR